MTQEQKDLLLKDLCARLPYGVKVSTPDDVSRTIKRMNLDSNLIEVGNYIDDVYVRDEQGNILKHHAHIGAFNLYDFQKIIIDVNKNE